MKILVVEDDPLSCELLVEALRDQGHEIAIAQDAEEGWKAVEQTGVRLIVCDWQLPRGDGLDLCRRLRASGGDYRYFILLTGAELTDEAHARAYAAGVDDFLSKSADERELKARLQVAERVLGGPTSSGRSFLPICTHCKDVRDGGESWQEIERYFHEHTGTRFSHGICPDCYERVARPQLENLREARPPPLGDQPV